MDFIQALNWRYAVKKMNTKKITEEKLQRVIESISLAPTSMGMQPFELVVIKNQELKHKLLPIAYNQPQVVDCSELIVFCAWTDHYEEKVNKYIQNIQDIRNVSEESLEIFKSNILKFLNRLSEEEKIIWSKNQAYIALGVALSACAFEKIDSTPMEGFDRDTLNKEFKLTEKGLKASVIVALGYRSDSDFNAKLPKSRLPDQVIFTRL